MEKADKRLMCFELDSMLDSMIVRVVAEGLSKKK